jgi:hypothetical protein
MQRVPDADLREHLQRHVAACTACSVACGTYCWEVRREAERFAELRRDAALADRLEARGTGGG